jgi:hypothetical protein
VPVERRPLGEVAAMHLSDEIRGTCWWTLAELDSAAERVRPEGLADLIRELLAPLDEIHRTPRRAAFRA